MTDLTILSSVEEDLKDIIFTDQHLIKLYQANNVDNPREQNNLGKMIFFNKFKSDQLVITEYQNIVSNKHLAKLIKQNIDFISFPIQFFQGERKSLSHIGCGSYSNEVIGISFIRKLDITSQFGNLNKIELFRIAKKILDKELERFEIYINNEAYEWNVWDLVETRTEKGKFIYVPTEKLQSGKNYTLDEAINDAKNYIKSLAKTPEFSL